MARLTPTISIPRFPHSVICYIHGNELRGDCDSASPAPSCILERAELKELSPTTRCSRQPSAGSARRLLRLRANVMPHEESCAVELTVMSKAKRSVKLLPCDAARYLTDDAAVAEYLTAVLEADDPDRLLPALADIARARGMAEVAKKAGLGRERLYEALSPGAKAALRHSAQGCARFRRTAYGASDPAMMDLRPNRAIGPTGQQRRCPCCWVSSSPRSAAPARARR